MLQRKDPEEKRPAAHAWPGMLLVQDMWITTHQRVPGLGSSTQLHQGLSLLMSARLTSNKMFMKFCSFPTLCKVQQQIAGSALVVFSPYTALQGITLNILREAGDCSVEPGCHSDMV